MPFKSPHVSFVTFCVEVGPSGTAEVMVIETDLHLNSRHPDYNPAAVQRLVQAAQAYLKDDGREAVIRLVSNRGGVT
ncbi:hypothetical protein ACH79_26980 [Bradyrhizobium sp. CCBAU 051011]|uniref:hypothetical protein n=1 Tax=Bradyrhizobium sp. CCBAU 051011 TaxID=858422 RepID=UPI0013740659|nr:hypothetical protein [Bradyrhizobium sp. CCBAU 051011]QHO75726.1 hypothetical protein ACH79_26980 [Bradyrhizobium sp. CCBAU 051011]